MQPGQSCVLTTCCMLSGQAYPADHEATVIASQFRGTPGPPSDDIDGVRVGDRCKVEAFAFLPPGVVLEDGPEGTTWKRA